MRANRRGALGEEEGNQFIADTFGPDGDSEDSDATVGEEVIEYTEREKEKLEIWKEFASAAGKPFWYNKYTRETSWTNPLSEKCDDLQSRTVEVLNNYSSSKSALVVVLQDLPDGWVQRKSKKKGFVYYQDIFSGERVWEQPLRQSRHRRPLDVLGGLLKVRFRLPRTRAIMLSYYDLGFHVLTCLQLRDVAGRYHRASCKDLANPKGPDLLPHHSRTRHRGNKF